MKTGIYKIQSKIKPERIYIGSAVNIDKRWRFHLNDLKRNTHHSIKLQRHYNKYGAEDLEFSILYECNKESLLRIEQSFLDLLNPYFNICKIASSTLGIKLSEEAKTKMRANHKGMNGKKHSEDTKAKMRKSHLGLKPMLGKKHSEETKQKLRKPKSEEAKRRIGKALKGKSAWNKGLKINNLYE